MVTSHIITLLTDFGSTDAFVGTMKGVILGISPHAQIVDLCHEVPPQDVFHGAFLLRSAWSYFPAGTVHVVVIDPGVGSDRRALAIECERHFFVGPDNGVLTLAATEMARCVQIVNRAYCLPKVSASFHGRDVFAPVAAHLSCGAPLEELGPTVTDWRRVEIPAPSGSEFEIRGEIVHIDRFGNLITNISELALRSWQTGAPVRITINGHTFHGIRNAYSEVEEGLPVALVGSAAFLEIAVGNGSAAQFFNVTCGNPVTLQLGCA